MRLLLCCCFELALFQIVLLLSYIFNILDIWTGQQQFQCLASCNFQKIKRLNARERLRFQCSLSWWNNMVRLVLAEGIVRKYGAEHFLYFQQETYLIGLSIRLFIKRPWLMVICQKTAAQKICMNFIFIFCGSNLGKVCAVY